MKRFVEGVDRGQSTLFPDRLEDWIGDDNPVRVVDVFFDELDPGGLGFDRVAPLATGRPGYHPSVLLKLYIYGYLNLRPPGPSPSSPVTSGSSGATACSAATQGMHARSKPSWPASAPR